MLTIEINGKKLEATKGETILTVARRNGIRGFTAEVLVENKPMQAVINKSNTKVSSKVGTGVVSFEMAFE